MCHLEVVGFFWNAGSESENNSFMYLRYIWVSVTSYINGCQQLFLFLNIDKVLYITNLFFQSDS